MVGLLFAILAPIMLVPRNVDWYQLGGGRPSASG
jgi:inner membrane protein involved in colicin E2 resistance